MIAKPSNNEITNNYVQSIYDIIMYQITLFKPSQSFISILLKENCNWHDLYTQPAIHLWLVTKDFHDEAHQGPLEYIQHLPDVDKGQ